MHQRACAREEEDAAAGRCQRHAVTVRALRAQQAESCCAMRTSRRATTPPLILSRNLSPGRQKPLTMMHDKDKLPLSLIYL